MDDNVQGQTLVELALLLPCFCLGILLAVQLIYYCHNMIELQRMAALDIERVRLEHFREKGKHFLFDSMFGPALPTEVELKKKSTPWRPFKGVSTITTPGQIVSVHESSLLQHGRGFSQAFAEVIQSADAETLLETPPPKDR